MARLASQVKAGFYPAPPEAVDKVLKALEPEGDFNVLDPCAGKGEALMRIVDRFDIGDTHGRGTPWAIELDEGRGAALKKRVGKAGTVLAPADVFTCGVTAESIQLLYLNPPYDTELGGGQGRTEQQFLRHCWDWLQPGGVLVFVIPEPVIGRYSPTLKFLHPRCDQLKYTPFPDAVRKFKEVFVLAVKRKYLLTDGYDEDDPPLPEPMTKKDIAQYVIPKRRGKPRTFAKLGMTTPEIELALATSPLQAMLRPPKPLPLARPPLPPSKGHTALLLSAGHLNGVVRPEGEEPHVVRGVCNKEEYLKGQTTDQRDDGSVVTKTTIAEKYVLVVRAVTPDGTFHTLK